MSLLDSVISKSVGSVMASSRPLAGMNSTTLAQAGTSLPQIQKTATEAARGSINPISAQTALSDPIEQMRLYALANTPSTSVHPQINNAAMDAVNQMDAAFTTSLPGTGSTLVEIQNSAGEAISSGIANFSDSLQSINSSVVSEATAVGNNALPAARQFSDELTTGIYNTASKSVSDQVVAANNALADKVQAQNSQAQAVAQAGLSDETQESSGALFTSSGVWAGKEDAAPAGVNTTDIVYQDVKVYIEGVQVPFEAVSISQNIGDLPSAIIQIPPQAGLMDIARYYQPKVHIFYTDKNIGGDRLLFWGHIVSCNYAKSRQHQGMATISFRCRHKNALFEQVTLEWSDYVNNTLTGGGDPNTNLAVAQVASLNSKHSLVSALKGITGMQTDAKDFISPTNTEIVNADVTKLDQRWSNFEKRMIGMPAASMNLWNQLKKTCYQNEDINTIMSKIYIPLIEDGIAFFDRISGHHLLENIIQESKEPYCGEKTDPAEPDHLTMVPPAFKLPSISAISQTTTIETLANRLNFSGEMATFAQLFRDFYLSVEYEMITLASPAQVPADPTVTVDPDLPDSSVTVPMMAIETIVKPQIPFYFSPVCNVLLPKMYHTINIDQDEEVIPTRITAYHDALPGSQNQMGSNYRAPNSIREAIAIGIGLYSRSRPASGPGAPTESAVEVNLKNTTGPSYNVPGKYEQGRGIHHRKLAMPYWLALLLKGRANAGGTEEVWPRKGSQEYNDMMNLYAAWVDRYGYDVLINDDEIIKARNTNKDTLNPYSVQAKIHPHERILFATADYEFTKQVAQSRNGVIDGVFNPYIVPGYPMDIIDESPNHPSFHALCASVTHTITSSSIGTSIGVVAAMTYAELSNYYLQPLHPWLQTALKMLNVTWDTGNSDSEDDAGSSQPPSSEGDQYGDVSKMRTVRAGLIGNPNAKQAADEFYRSVFGVDSVSPDDLYDFSLGQAIPVARHSGTLTTGVADSLRMANGGEGNDFLTSVGNLRLVTRPIEGKQAIQSKFGVKFIDLLPQNYSASGYFYQNPILSADLLLEPGASLFLEYEETEDFVNGAWATRTGGTAP